jgi:Concanavalin A-like lectin/glucanases superfamily
MPDEWTRILFVHDGLSMQIYLDGVLAAYRNDIQAPVPGVQAGGVVIGRGYGANLGFKGLIDHVRIWKFDPYARQRRFFCRKMDPHTEACWRDLFTAMVHARKDEKTRADMEQALICVQKAEERLIRAVQAKGRSAMQQAAQFARRYQELWCKGDLDSEEMKRLIAEWSEWIGDATGNAFTNYLADIISCLPVLQKAMPEVAARLKTCDPAFLGFLRSLCEGMVARPGSPPYRGDKGKGTYPHNQGAPEPDYRQRKRRSDEGQPTSRDELEY